MVSILETVNVQQVPGTSQKHLNSIIQEAGKLRDFLLKMSASGPSQSASISPSDAPNLFFEGQFYKNLVEYANKLSSATTYEGVIYFSIALSELWHKSQFSDAITSPKQHLPFIYEIAQSVDFITIALSQVNDEARENVNKYIEAERQKVIQMVSSFENHVNSIQLDVNTKLTKTDKDLDALNEKLNRELSKAELMLEQKQKEIDSRISSMDKLIGAISAKGLSAGYGNQALKEELIATGLRNRATKYMNGLAFIAIVFIIASLFRDFSFGQSILKAVALLLIAMPALYLAKESNRHRNMQSHFQKNALDIAGLPPYLTELSKDEQDRIKGELAIKFFTREMASEKNTQLMDSDLKEFLFKYLNPHNLAQSKDNPKDHTQ